MEDWVKRRMIAIRWILVAVVAVAVAGAVAGCRVGGLVPFTQKVRYEFEDYLPGVQFYTSREIILVRTSQSEEKSISGKGKEIEVKTEKIIESVTIPRHTPGTLRYAEGDIFYVQFEPDDDGGNRVLPFVLRSAVSEDAGTEKSVFIFDQDSIEYDGERYSVLYEEGSIPVTETDGAVYAGQPETGTPAQFISAKFYPYLMIHSVQARDNLTKKSRTVKGLKVEKAP
jgi:hypothetical protein